MSGTLPWYVARASGLVAWGLLAGSVVWGLLMTSKVIRRFARSSWLLDLHRWLAGLALVFTTIHVMAILGDTYIHFGLASVLVPLAAKWHPVMVAYGIVSLYLLLAIEVTSLLRRRINRKLWRAVHFLSFPLFVSSTVHGLTAGTDSRAPMVVITVVLVATAVAALTAVRVATSKGVALIEPRPPTRHQPRQPRQLAEAHPTAPAAPPRPAALAAPPRLAAPAAPAAPADQAAPSGLQPEPVGAMPGTR